MIVVGSCPASDAQGQPCQRSLFAFIRDRDDPRPSVIRCQGDTEHVWEPNDWPALGKRIGAPGLAKLLR